jgi:L-asparaginase II
MPATPLRIEATRGDLIESVHPVSAAVVDRFGDLVAYTGDAELVTFWRSAAKPFQAMPMIADGAADRFGLTGGSGADVRLALQRAAPRRAGVPAAREDRLPR